MWPTLDTGRLVLRPLGPADLGPLVELQAQGSFWWYPFGRGFTADETEAFLRRTIERYGFGPAVSAVVVRATGDLAGWAGLSVPDFLPEILPAVAIGWRLGTPYWGRGFATEAGEAWVRYGFEAPANIASGVVIHRLGFTLDPVAVHPTLESAPSRRSPR